MESTKHTIRKSIVFILSAMIACAVLVALPIGFQNNAGQDASFVGQKAYAATKVSFPVDVDGVHFPDSVFRAYVNETYAGGDSILTEEEAKKVTSIVMRDKGLTSLQGIECFSKLTELDCQSNMISQLDVSQNLELKSLRCTDNMLTSLDLSANKKLETVLCGGNMLLDIQGKSKTYWSAGHQSLTITVQKDPLNQNQYISSNTYGLIDGHTCTFDGGKARYDEATKRFIVSATGPHQFSTDLGFSTPSLEGYIMTPSKATGEIVFITDRYKLFADSSVLEKHWVTTEGWLDYVCDKNLMTGYLAGPKAGSFVPDDTMTRAMAATILYRAGNGSAASGNNQAPFYDVPAGTWYSDAVAWCKSTGIVNGYENAQGQQTGFFGPDDLVTREQLAKMVALFAQSKGQNIKNASSDNFKKLKGNDKHSAYSEQYLIWCTSKEIITGFDNKDGTYSLNAYGNASRGAAAKMITVALRDVISK